MKKTGGGGEGNIDANCERLASKNQEKKRTGVVVGQPFSLLQPGLVRKKTNA